MSRLLVLIVAGLVSACAATPPEQQVVNDAAAALGGAGRLQALKSLSIEGAGTAPQVGQNTMPDGEQPVWRVRRSCRIITSITPAGCALPWPKG